MTIQNPLSPVRARSAAVAPAAATSVRPRGRVGSLAAALATAGPVVAALSLAAAIAVAPAPAAAVLRAPAVSAAPGPAVVAAPGAPVVAPVAARAFGSTPTAGPTAAPGGTAMCTVTDPRAQELSGLLATPTGYVSMNDSRDEPAQIRVFYLDQRCRVVRTQGYPTPARDPEDIAQAPDGSLWVADTGDNDRTRTTVALWHVPSGGGAPVIHRLSYPDGAHDAEALLFTGAGVPVIVTKDLSGTAGLYEPTGPLRPDTKTGVRLRLVGQFTPQRTGVANPLGAFGEILVTGAAVSPDRARVALRTYAAAYEWDVPDGDVVRAITTTAARVTPLPNEPQGEGLSYTVDGSRFLTVSDETGPTTIRRYARSTTPAAAGPTTTAAAILTGRAAAVARLASVPPWALAGLAVGGFAVAGAGIVSLRRGRRRQGLRR